MRAEIAGVTAGLFTGDTAWRLIAPVEIASPQRSDSLKCDIFGNDVPRTRLV